MTIIWEHGHAYQPRRLVDSILNENRRVQGGVHRNLLGRMISDENWFELMLSAGGIYENIVNTLGTRSIDVEPITLFSLSKADPQTYMRLLKMVAEGRASLFPSTYSHPILPMLASQNFFDAKINVLWGIRYVLKETKYQGGPIFFWLSECAYSELAAQAVLQAVNETYPSARVFLLLDEFQAGNIDPSQTYKVQLVNGAIELVFRSRWVSDAYAFSNNTDALVNSLRDYILSRRPELIGVAVDAETYGGAYDPNKPLFFSRIRDGIDGSVSNGYSTVTVEFLPVDKAVENKPSSETKMHEGSSWSNYEDSQLLHPSDNTLTGILARRLGAMCRWSGMVPGIDGQDDTYFIVSFWTDPKSKKEYVSVVNSIWKIAFNSLRTRVSTLVRNTVFELLQSLLGHENTEKAIAAYGEIIFETMKWDVFVSKFLNERATNETEATRLLLESYRMAVQEASMSDPTYWENMDTEVTWTALSLLASGIVQAAKACLLLGKSTRFLEMAEEYEAVFLDFRESFRTLYDEYGFPLEILYNYLREQCLKKGYDLEQDLANPAAEKQLQEIAEKAYTLTFDAGPDRPVRKSDVNPFLLEWRLNQKRGVPEAAQDAWGEACSYEWEKSIKSVVSDSSIPVRVGLLHAKHFPKNEVFSSPLEEPETSTELICGEADAYK